MKKFLAVILMIVALFLIGVIRSYRQSPAPALESGTMGESAGTSSESASIQTGSFPMDTKALQTLQANVNAGNDAWRLDPEQTLLAEAPQYGFTDSDLAGRKLIFQAESAAVYQYEISHGGVAYVVSVTKPVPGQGRIWALSSIEKK